MEKNLLNTGIYLVLIFLAGFLGPRILHFFFVFVVGLLIAMIANPLVRFLERKVKIRRKHSSVFIIIGVLALLIVGGYNLIALLIRQAVEFGSTLPEKATLIQNEFQKISDGLTAFLQTLPIPLENPLPSSNGSLGELLRELLDQMTSPTMAAAGSVAKGLPKALVYTVVVILSSYFFLADREKLISWFSDHLPGPALRVWDVLQNSAKRIIGGYFSAQAKIMLVVMLELFVGFWILGEDYALLLAFLISLLDFLPVFGTGTVLIPWAVYSLLIGDFGKMIALGLIYLVSQVIHQGIQPKMVGDSMGLSPLYTLFLLFIGFRLYGLGGMILAVPVGLVILELYKSGLFDSLFQSLLELGQDINDLRRGLPDRRAGKEGVKNGEDTGGGAHRGTA